MRSSQSTEVLLPSRQEGRGANVGLREKKIGILLKVHSPCAKLQALSNRPPISIMCVSEKVTCLNDLSIMQSCAVSRYSLSRACIEAIFRLGICLKRHIYGCRSVSRVEKIHFAYANDTFCVSMGLETVSESVSKDTIMCVENNLAGGS